MAGELCNSDTPKRQLDTEKKSEEHAQGLAIEESAMTPEVRHFITEVLRVR